MSWVFPSGSVKRTFESWNDTSMESGCECIGLFAPGEYVILSTRTVGLSISTL